MTLGGGSNGQLTLEGATLKRDPFAGDWAQGEVPAQGEYTGTIVFDCRIPDGATAATLVFPTIFSLDLSAPRNMSVDLRLMMVAKPLT